MNKFILGGILAAISLMAIYGTSASNRVTSWVDRTGDTSAQTNFVPDGDGSDGTVVALNGNEANGDSIGIISSQTPLEKAGDIPRRQTLGVRSSPAINAQPSNTGDDTGGVVVEPNPQTGDANTATSPPANQGQAQQGQAQQGQNQNLPPVRALW